MARRSPSGVCRLLGVLSCHREFTEHTQATSQGCPNCTLRSAGIGIAGNANCAVTWLGIMRGKSLLQRESARVQREELERLPSVEPPSAHRPACLCTLAADAASRVAEPGCFHSHQQQESALPPRAAPDHRPGLGPHTSLTTPTCARWL